VQTSKQGTEQPYQIDRVDAAIAKFSEHTRAA